MSKQLNWVISNCSCDWIIWRQIIKMQDDLPCFWAKLEVLNADEKEAKNATMDCPKPQQKLNETTPTRHSEYHCKPNLWKICRYDLLNLGVKRTHQNSFTKKSPGPQTDGTLVLVLVAGQVTVLLFAWGQVKSFWGIFMEISWQSILGSLSGIKYHYISAVLYRFCFLSWAIYFDSDFSSIAAFWG